MATAATVDGTCPVVSLDGGFDGLPGHDRVRAKDPNFQYCRLSMGDNATEQLKTRFDVPLQIPMMLTPDAEDADTPNDFSS